MQYFGGKTKISKQIVEFLESIRKENQTYIEPFVDGGIICSKMSGKRIASDFNEYLIEMYKAVQDGWIPPTTIIKEQYDYIKNNKDEDKALTGFVGFGCSFAGKWFGGYAKNKQKHNYCKASKNSLLRKMSTMQEVEFKWKDYKTLEPYNCLIYCDPPYKNTTKYTGVPNFNTDEFWNVMREWSKYNTVIISEYEAPDDFECVLEIPTKTNIRDSSGNVSYRVEKLFKYKQQ